MIVASKRLDAILEWVDGNLLADIGCDHAYVACYSVLNHKVQKAYACDIATGPLENAKKTIVSLHLEEKVIPVLMDGIQKLDSNVDCLVIAGMGSKTIESILLNGDYKREKLLLMPHKDDHQLRLFCMNHHLRILRERMVYEDSHYYPLMDLTYDESFDFQYSDCEIYYGVNMIQDTTYLEYLKKEQAKWNAILKQMPEDKNSDCLYRIKLLKELRQVG